MQSLDGIVNAHDGFAHLRNVYCVEVGDDRAPLAFSYHFASPVVLPLHIQYPGLLLGGFVMSLASCFCL